jgi:hypothetical protein
MPPYSDAPPISKEGVKQGILTKVGTGISRMRIFAYPRKGQDFSL